MMLENQNQRNQETIRKHGRHVKQDVTASQVGCWSSPERINKLFSKWLYLRAAHDDDDTVTGP